MIRHFTKIIVCHAYSNSNSNSRNKEAACIIENGEHHYHVIDQTNSFARFLEDLVIPKDKGNESEFLELCNIRHNVMQQMCEYEDAQETNILEFCNQNIQDAIQMLHSGKPANELGLTAEHFKNSPSIDIKFLTICFNTILKDKQIPDIFKTGIVTPVLKKGKNPMNMDNYRGIAVTPVISKLFEYAILPTLAGNFTQYILQFGFTKGMSMLMAGSLICETRAEAKYVTIEPLYLVTVDSQKAFDVVDHIIMLDAYYENIPNHPLWSVVKKLYTELVSKVKWKGNTSNSFQIHQGGRQEGFLSPFLYKLYVNNLLEDYKTYNLGFTIRTTYVGCSTCADDIGS